MKAIDLQNRSTNNAVNNLERDYEQLVLVVLDERVEYFILTRKEVVAAYAPNNPWTIYISQIDCGRYKVREELRTYEGQWGKIIGE